MDYSGFDPPRLDVWDSEVTRQENQFTEYFKQDIFVSPSRGKG